MPRTVLLLLTAALCLAGDAEPAPAAAPEAQPAVAEPAPATTAPVAAPAPAPAAQPAPAWLGEAARAAAFPDAQWLSATAEERTTPERDRAKCLEMVATAAQNELARSVRVRVEAVTESKTVEITGASGSRFDSTFSDQSMAIVGVWLDLRRLETWFDEESGTAHAVCAVERRVLADSLRARAEAALGELSASADEAQAHETAGRANDAAIAWVRLLAAARGVGDDLILARGVAPAEADAALAARLAAVHTRAATAQARLAGRAIASADDLAWVLAQQLARGAGEAKPVAMVPAFTVRDSRLSSQFGRYAAQLLGNQLVKAGGWKVMRASAAGPARDAVAASGAEVVILGATWDGPEGVRVVVAAHTLADGRMVAAAEATLPKAGIAATGLATEPQNAAAALADQQAFRREEVIGGGMKLEVWTSKGDDAPVFTKGERVQIFARVDRPSYLRIVYHLADGRRALLLDNLFIDADKVNQVYLLPDEFEVDAPFGAETLQASAATKPFPKLGTRMEDGYPILLDGLDAANAKTRGLKKVDNSELRQAESRVVVTTVER